ncbi:DUF362 domain-containing protein [Candidatus Thorarchaeota archaeon]|nr:MAG: DUF362 domain-containing protein [Candidatus Thorarchaeota archaeon]
MQTMTNQPSQVYFGSIQHGNPGRFASMSAKLEKIIKHLDFSTIEKKDKVAIKMHLGFRDGYQTVPVFFARRVVEAVKETGGYPFVTDNPTAVYNAAERGYTSETLGCPLIPVAGVKDGYHEEREFDFHNVDTLSIAGVLRDADVLIDLSHAKGHNTCGYGGAIKNIALGGYTGPSRWKKIHGVENSIEYWDADKCSPEHAKELVETCPEGHIKYDEEKHELTIAFGMCNQCMECIDADEGTDCLHFGPENFALFQELMANGANEIIDTFDEDKRFYLNFLLDITALCDCWGIAQPAVVNDIGILGSRDIVAIEQATLDLIAKEGLVESMIPPYFRNVDLDSEDELHPFARIHGRMKTPYLVTEYAENLGMGSRSYELIELLSPDETKEMEAPKGVSEDQPTFF